MGIPSYYKNLKDVHPGLIGSQNPSKMNWLFMDFNCLIYHCLSLMESPYDPLCKEEWEQELVEAVIRYTLKVIRTVGPRKGVFIAVDGVVPMAKMRQQRLRRFKGSLSASSGWDRNAITPGTEFMTKIRLALEAMIREQRTENWLLSSSDEPGEGEHKLLHYWRSKPREGNIAVYGLDADLILLSLLGSEQQGNSVWLFREQVEKGVVQYDKTGSECFEWFSIGELRAWLCSSVKEEDQKPFVLQYIFAMSVLGNDFLPRSLSFTLREEGHGELLHLLRTLYEQKKGLLTEEGDIQMDHVRLLFRWMADQEEERMMKAIAKKRRMAQIYSEKQGPGEENWPLSQKEEFHLMEHPYARELKKGWESVYLTRFFPGLSYHPASIKQLCDAYWHGIQWIWSYYNGKMEQVCYEWYYPHSLPPLWKWLSRSISPVFPGPITLRANEIRTSEQLAVVLPLTSWSLLPASAKERHFPSLAPHYFPKAFSFESVGKRYFWECEPLLPIPSIRDLKRILSRI